MRVREDLSVFDLGCIDEARCCLRVGLSGIVESLVDLGIGVVIVLDERPELGS